MTTNGPDLAAVTQEAGAVVCRHGYRRPMANTWRNLTTRARFGVVAFALLGAAQIALALDAVDSTGGVQPWLRVALGLGFVATAVATFRSPQSRR